jgi:hypothetical protein
METIMLRTSTTSPFDLIDGFSLAQMLTALPDRAMAERIETALQTARQQPLVLGNVELIVSVEQWDALWQIAQITPL